MKIQHRFNQEADSAAARYGVLTEALRGIYLSAFNDPRFGSPALLAAIEYEARALMTTYLRTERQQAEMIFGQIVREALQATKASLAAFATLDTPEALSALASATLDYLMKEMRLQGERDVSTLVEAVRRASLQVSLAMRAHGLSQRLAIRDYAFGANNLDFYFRDRRNYRTLSRQFMRVVWRQSLLSVYNESVLLTLADHGETQAEVTHLDGKSGVDGLIIAMSGGSVHPIYDEIRAQVFHPNADAVLKRVGAA